MRIFWAFVICVCLLPRWRNNYIEIAFVNKHLSTSWQCKCLKFYLSDILNSEVMYTWKSNTLLTKYNKTCEGGHPDNSASYHWWTHGKESANFYNIIHVLLGRGSWVGIATGYGLDGPGIESRCGRDLPHTSRPALGPTQPSVEWVPSHSWG